MDPLRRSLSPCSSRPTSCEMLGYVGIEAVLDQLKIKAMKMGFEFNIMVVGQSGLGKSTMVNTLFKSKIWKSTPSGLVLGSTPQTLQLHSMTHVIEEKGVKLKLTVTDTPGFGDQINNDKWGDYPKDPGRQVGLPGTALRSGPSPTPAGTPSWATSMDSMSSTCRRRSSSPASATSPTPGCTAVCTSCRPLGTGEVAGPTRAERRSGERRRRGFWHGLWAGIPSLTHLLLPLPPPSLSCLSSLRPLDIEFLQRLCRTVNVVPVIARADSLTIEERENFRRTIQHNLRTHSIDVYPQQCFDEDVNDKILNCKIRDRIPFAVVGADREHVVNGRCVLGRKTKWGIIEVENMEHCEFPLLRDLLIRSHLQDLKDITHNVYYENYRVCRLNESHMLPQGPGWVNLDPTPASPPAIPGPSKMCRWTQDNPSEEY
ncbi:PREDICTED: septin-12 isoform X1 [Myotis brandtii]|uniref:septin-12 isoform X1 n=2 Tax=Myotis brandtii TaxID=109478 RepID=UPI0003BB71B8|nr:PREDICTED: septin-12 isoform X1 [Myotis brandtii]